MSMMQTDCISVLIADDEPPARRLIRSLIEQQPNVQVVGEARSGRETIETIQELRPDVVFLDVQMPEGDAFEVIRTIGVGQMPVVVFAIAYDEYALRAFQAHALDYLLKPYDRERFEDALERARLQVQRTHSPGVDPRLLALLRHLDERTTHLERLAVQVGSRIRLLDVDDVDYLKAESNYVRLHVAAQSHLIRDTLTALEGRLDPARFLRVHRSLIVNLSRIVEVESLFAGEYILFLRGGTRLTSGRAYRRSVQHALHLRS